MSTGQDLHKTCPLQLIDAAVVAAGTAVGLLTGVSLWLAVAVPVGLAAHVGLYLPAVAVQRGRDPHDTP
jgi:hypothetical protein